MRLHSQEENRERPVAGAMQNQNQQAAGKDGVPKRREPRPLTPLELASLFTEKFYSKLKSGRENLFQFFGDDSRLVAGYEGEKVKVCIGQEQIHRRFQEPDYRITFTDVISVDALEIGNGQFMIQTTGLCENVDSDQLRFHESFVLAPQNGGGFYVLTNVRRIARETVAQKEAAPPVAAASKAAGVTAAAAIPKSVNAQDIPQKEELTKPMMTQNMTGTPAPAPAASSELPLVTPPISAGDAAAKRGDSKRTNAKPSRGGGYVTNPAPEIAKPATAAEPPSASDSAKKPTKIADTVPVPNTAPVVAVQAAAAPPPPQGAPPSQPARHPPNSAPSSTSTAPATAAGPPPVRTWASAAANNATASWDKKNIAEVKGTSTKPSQLPAKTSPPPSAHGRRRSSDLSSSVFVRGASHPGVTKEDIAAAFSVFGEVVNVDIRNACAFVQFSSPGGAVGAVGNSVMLPGGVHVTAEPKRDMRGVRPQQSSGTGRGGGGGGPRGGGMSGRGGDRGSRRKGS